MSTSHEVSSTNYKCVTKVQVLKNKQTNKKEMHVLTLIYRSAYVLTTLQMKKLEGRVSCLEGARHLHNLLTFIPYIQLL